MPGALTAVLSIVLAAAPGPVCRPAETDLATRPIPPPLAASVAEAFKVTMPPSEVEANGVMRCAAGRLLACLVGANLNCSKADMQTGNAGADDWCRQHANADFVPAFATGHDTIYTWRCDGPRAAIERQVWQVDPQGFVVENWRPVGQ